MKESAAQRALGIFEIVDLIASHIQIDFSMVSRAEDFRLWNDAGFIARGVNSLWKQTFDQKMLRSTTNSSMYTCLDRLPLPFLRIMAISPELSSSLNRIKAYYPHRWQLDAVCSILIQSIGNLQSLSIDTEILVAISAQVRARPPLRLPRLRELQLGLSDYRGPDLMNADDVESVALLLATMTSVTSLSLTLHTGWSQQLRQYVLSAQQARVVMSIPSLGVQRLELVCRVVCDYRVKRDV